MSKRHVLTDADRAKAVIARREKYEHDAWDIGDSTDWEATYGYNLDNCGRRVPPKGTSGH